MSSAVREHNTGHNFVKDTPYATRYPEAHWPRAGAEPALVPQHTLHGMRCETSAWPGLLQALSDMEFAALLLFVFRSPFRCAVGMCFMFCTINTYFTEHLAQQSQSAQLLISTLIFWHGLAEVLEKAFFQAGWEPPGKLKHHLCGDSSQGSQTPNQPTHVNPCSNAWFESSRHKSCLQGDVQHPGTVAKVAAEPWGALCCPCTWRGDICDKLRTGACVCSPPSD